MSKRGQVKSAESAPSTVRLSFGTDFGMGLVEAAVLAATVAVPLFFNPATERVFEPDKLAMLQVMGALALAGFIWRFIVDGRGPRWGLPRSRVAISAVVLVAAVCAASLLAPRTDLALWGSYRRATGLPTYLALGVLAAAAAVALDGAPARRRWYRALALSVLAASAYALLQRAGVDSLYWGAAGLTPQARAFGPTGNPIFLGAFMVVALPFVLAGGLSGSRASRTTYGATAVMALAALGAAASRGPVMGLVAGAGFITLLLLARTGRRRLAAALLAGATVLACVMFLSAGAGRTLGGLGDKLWESRTSQERLLLWETILDRAGDGPAARLAMGYGPDSLAPLVTAHLPSELIRLTPDQVYDRAHNFLLEWWVTGGLIALLAAAALVLSSLLACAACMGLSANRWALPAALGVGGFAAALGAMLRPGLAPLAGAAGLVAAAAAFIVAAKGARMTPAQLAGDPTAIAALAVAGALAAHVAEASFGLPSAPSALIVWVAIGIAVRFEMAARSDDDHGTASAILPTHARAERAPRSAAVASDERSAATAEGIVDGLALATVAFAPLLLPSPQATSGQPALWLLLPALWVAADLLSDAQGGPWARPAARVGVLLVFGGLFAVHPRLGAGGSSAAYAMTLIAAALGLAFALSASRTKGAAAAVAPPWRVLAGAAALVLCLCGAWRQSVRPVMADGHVLASLRAGTGGDHPAAITHAERAAAMWSEQPALASFVAAAHRSVMLDTSLSAEVRQAAFDTAASTLEAAMERAPAADTAAKLGDLYRDRGDYATAGPEADGTWTTALDWYEQSLQLQPAYPAALEAYASTLERLGDYEGALALNERALAIDPPRQSARAGLIRAHLARDELAQARHAVSDGLALDSTGLGAALDEAVDTRADPVRVLQSRLLFAVETGARESAVALLTQLRTDAPDDPITTELSTLAGAARD